MASKRDIEKAEAQDKETQKREAAEAFAEKVMQTKYLKTTTGRCFVLESVAENNIGHDLESRGAILAKLRDSNNIVVSGRGHNEKAAVMAAISHLELMGSTIAR